MALWLRRGKVSERSVKTKEVEDILGRRRATGEAADGRLGASETPLRIGHVAGDLGFAVALPFGCSSQRWGVSFPRFLADSTRVIAI